MERCILSYNGERQDPVSGAFHLGKGYRAYHPQLLRFVSPDSFSPFGADGINAYAYCAGDPVNHADPSGHFNWQAGLGMGLAVLGLLSAAFTGGMSLVAEGGLMAALNSGSAISLLAGAAGMVADSTGIVSVLNAGKNQAVSDGLSWLSMASGIISGSFALSSALLSVRKAFTSLSDSSAYIRLGNEENVRTFFRSDVPNILRPDMKDVNFLFDDSYKGGKRLNIVAHSTLDEASGTAQIRNNMVILTGGQFSRHLGYTRYATYRDYQFARIVMCDSAAGEENSFAAGFALASGLPTKGYIGDVHIRLSLHGIVNQTSLENMPEKPLSIELLNRDLRIKKLTEPDLFRLGKAEIPYPYQPVYFDRSGKKVNGFERIISSE